MKRNKKLILQIALSVVLAILSIVGIFIIISNSQKVNYHVDKKVTSNTSVVGEIVKGVEIKQEVLTTENFNGLQILFANYANSNVNSQYSIKVLLEDGKVLYDKNVNASEFSDNAYYNIIFNEPYEVKGKKAEIIVSSLDATKENSLTIWKTDDVKEYEDGELYVDGEQVDGDIVFNIIEGMEVKNNSGVIFYRILLCLAIIVFVLLNIWVDVKKLYDFIYKYRVVVALTIFGFLVINKIHYSSIGMYDSYVQTGNGSQYVETIMGKPRPIRSDEWMVSTPRRLTTAFEGVIGKNNIPMALEVNNITASGIQLGWGVLGTPQFWGYLTGDTEIGVSFYWNAVFIFTFLFSFEFCLLISKKNKLLSLLGAVLLTYSSYCLWWSFGPTWLMYSQAAIVLFNYAVNSASKVKKALYGIGTALAGAGFVTNLYPAWQVPAGYMSLIILLCVIIASWKNIKKFDWKDWTIILSCVAFMISIIAAYLLSNMEYVNSITNTVYPGSRVSNGGYTLYKLSNCIGAWMFSYREIANPSEAGIVFNLFPLPIILGIVYMIKKKKWDGLVGALTIFSLFLTLYCSLGIPMVLSKLTLMSNSVPERAVDVLAIVQLYLFIAIVGRICSEGILKRIAAYAVVFVVMMAMAYQFNVNMPTYYNKYELLCVVLVVTVCVVPWLVKAKAVERIASVVILGGITFVFGMAVHPVMKGLDVIYSKPVAQEIARIVEEEKDANWISMNHVTGGFTIACGAPTINSTNYIPNYELWEILDEDGVYNDCYNRYAHMTIVLTEEETSVRLLYADHIVVNLSYDDLEKIDVKYIYSSEEMVSGGNVTLKEIYGEYNSYIYEVVY
ncbi:MAG: alanine:cation symporter family protein [Lachnospiraceae bacterium]|nr:alanine:cation symporter family protein [Lachnospiraceae bacterium]